MSATRLILRLLLSLLLAAVILILISLAAFYLGWYFFGLVGHPAAPDVSAWVYLVYAVAAPLASVGLSAWLVFRRRER